MRDNIHAMTDTFHPAIVSVLVKAKSLIEARGYQPTWGAGGPLNISNALSIASENYDQYLAARHSFSKLWGGPLKEGLLGWETYKRRAQSEVLELIDTVILGVQEGTIDAKASK